MRRGRSGRRLGDTAAFLYEQQVRTDPGGVETTTIQVALTQTIRKREVALQVALALTLAGAALAPGFLVPWYFPALSTLLFFGLLLIVARAYLAAIVSFAPARTPARVQDANLPRVSVLVPAYNEVAVLPETMRSMLAVDYPAELIEFVYIYEARCKDGTNEVVREFAKRDNRFKAVERDAPGGGKAAATNFGLRHCTGEFIVSLDADHILDPGAVRRAIAWFAADSKIACVKGRSMGRNGDETYLAMQAKVERDVAEKADIYMRHVLKGFTIFGGGQAFFRKRIFDQIGQFDETILVEDIDFSVRIHASGNRLVVDPSILTFEENPAYLAPWWAQRKRWARGWMQVASRYLPRIHKLPNLTVRQRMDMYHTFAYVILPVAFIMLFPLFLLGLAGFDTAAWGVTSSLPWQMFALAPAFMSACVLLQDRLHGIRHPLREVLGVITFWPYLIFQTGVFWSAFLEEFVLRRPSVYVKTEKTGKDGPALHR